MHEDLLPLWVLGHLTLVEGMIPAELFGDKNPAAGWQQFFGESSEPVADAKKSIHRSPIFERSTSNCASGT